MRTSTHALSISWRAIVAALVFVPVAMLSSACMTARTASRVSSVLEHEIPELSLDREFGLTLGRVSLAMVRTALRRSDDADSDEALEILQGVRRAEVGIYRVTAPYPTDSAPRLASLAKRFTRDGWYNIVRSQGDGDHTWVYSKTDPNGDLRGLLVVDLADDELVVVRLDGQLQAALESAAADDPKAVAGVLSSSS
jgi:hypothetical protein